MSDLVLRAGGNEAVLVPDRARPRAYTLQVGGADQSYVDLDDPLRLEFDYVQRLADVLESVAAPGERVGIVHVGGAALTLPRYVAATRPRSAQVVLEPDAELTAFVREHLPLPRQSGIKVRDTDGRTGIAALRDDYAQVVVVDAFAGAQVPADLTTAEFLTDARRVLSESGVFLLNITDRGPFGYGRRVLAGVRSVFGDVAFCAEPATIKGRRFGNVVLAASGRPLPLDAIARRAGSAPYPYRVLHGPRLDQLQAGAAPFTEADSAPSPAPPEDLLFG